MRWTYHLFILFNFLIVTALTTPSHAQSSATATVEQLIEQMLIEPEPEKVIGRHIDRLIHLYLIGYQNLQQFDRELDEALAHPEKAIPAGTQSATYAKIQANRHAMLKAEDLLGEIYSELVEKRLQLASGDPLKPLVERIIEHFDQAVAQLQGVDRLAAMGLIRKLQSVSAGHTPLRIESDALLGIMSTPSENAQELVNKHQNELKERAQNEVPNDEDLARADRAVATHQQLHAVAVVPQNRIGPSVGPNGKLNGNNFPENYWALTYDDGPSSAYTPKVLTNLSNHAMEATFFWLAENVIRSGLRTIIDTAGKLGHARGNHSWSHPQLPKLGQQALRHEIVDSKVAEERVYGTPIEFFRLPYGAGESNTAICQMVADNNMIVVSWNVDSLDWQDHDPSSILSRVLKQMQLQHHGIILFHDIHSQSVEASRLLMDYVVNFNTKNPARALYFKTLPQMRALLNGETDPNLPKK